MSNESSQNQKLRSIHHSRSNIEARNIIKPSVSAGNSSHAEENRGENHQPE